MQRLSCCMPCFCKNSLPPSTRERQERAVPEEGSPPKVDLVKESLQIHSLDAPPEGPTPPSQRGGLFKFKVRKSYSNKPAPKNRKPIENDPGDDTKGPPYPPQPERHNVSIVPPYPPKPDDDDKQLPYINC